MIFLNETQLTEASKKYDYDDAIDYIESKGISCDPAGSKEGEYVCDLLDDDYDGYDQYDEPYYYKGTLDSIISQAKQYLKELEDEEEDEEEEEEEENTNNKKQTNNEEAHWVGNIKIKGDTIIGFNLHSDENIIIPDTIRFIDPEAWWIWRPVNIYVADNNSWFSSENGVLYDKNKYTLIKYPEEKEGSHFTIPKSVTSIGNSAFSNCSGLTSVIIGENVTSIGINAFWGCYNLTNIEIPKSVTSIGINAFEKCTSLSNINIPEGVTKIEGNTFYECSSLTEITLPNSITSIGRGAFDYCKNLTSINIPEGVTSIGDFAFYECTNLSGTITIPDSVTSIGEGAFDCCRSLTSIIIPNNVTEIKRWAFPSKIQLIYFGTEEKWKKICDNYYDYDKQVIFKPSSNTLKENKYEKVPLKDRGYIFYKIKSLDRKETIQLRKKIDNSEEGLPSAEDIREATQLGGSITIGYRFDYIDVSEEVPETEYKELESYIEYKDYIQQLKNNLPDYRAYSFIGGKEFSANFPFDNFPRAYETISFKKKNS